MNFIRSCLFVTIFVDKVPVKMLVDTGASVSIISEKTIKRLNLDMSLISRENVDLTTEDGSFLKVIGQLQLNFKIVKNCVSQNVYVARLESGYGFPDQFEIRIKSQRRVSNYEWTRD